MDASSLVTYAYTMDVQTAYVRATRALQGRLIAPYQRDGVCWMLFREQAERGPKGGFLCDEMGLGKTVQVITTMLGNPKPNTLVVVPKSIVNQWHEEIDHFAPHLKVYLYDGPKRTTNVQELMRYDVVVAPYSLLVNKKEETEPTLLHQIQWDRVVLDEGHEIRNKKSKVSVSVRRLCAGIRWIISGTPVYNSMRDFVTLCQFIGLNQQIVQGHTETVRKSYILRRTKEDVAKFNPRLTLPPCDFENVELDMTQAENELYTSVFKDSCESVKQILRSTLDQNEKTMEILECILRCRQVMIHPQLYYDGIARQNGDEEPQVWEGPTAKMSRLFEMIESHPDEKALVFSLFTGEMKYIKSELERRGKTVFVINGSVDRDLREKQIKAFRNFNGGCVFVIQIKSGGQGLNLQQATRVYITAPAWNPATELQAIARSHRTGQTKRVVVRKLIYSGTEEVRSIEHSIMGLQGEKSEICAKVLNDDRLTSQVPTKTKKNVTIHQLKKIFRLD